MKLYVACLIVILGAVAVVALPAGRTPSQPWVTSGYYQGDIKLSENQKNGIIDGGARWPNREMPYVISGSFDANDRNVIQDAINWYNANTCVRLVPHSGQANYVNIINSNSGCYSYVGVIGGAQELNLQTPGCVYHNTVVHEMLHALGFWHMQSATERDDFVAIQWQNIQAGTEGNFDKYGSDYITEFGERYDYGSVMHYGAWDFSSNGEKTIVTLDPNAVIGQAPTLSGIDISKLNRMYGC